MDNLGRLVRARYSCRSFRDEPVARPVLEALLETAASAPSGGNLQPWGVKVLTGQSKQSFSALARLEAERYPDLKNTPDLFYPSDLRDHYVARRRKTGYALYNALGIERSDHDARADQMKQNYDFFGASAGLIVYTDHDSARNQWLDLGGYVQTLCLAATEIGLATCIQGIWTIFNRPSDPVKEMLGLGDQHWLVCGVSLGHPDADAAANSFRTDRVGLSEYVEYLD